MRFLGSIAAVLRRMLKRGARLRDLEGFMLYVILHDCYPYTCACKVITKEGMLVIPSKENWAMIEGQCLQDIIPRILQTETGEMAWRMNGLRSRENLNSHEVSSECTLPKKQSFSVIFIFFV